MHHLIISICDNGNADDIMSTARKAGATGGTIVHARGSAKKEVEHFLGITIQPEKDMILIIVGDKTRNLVMQAIAKNHGIGSKSHAVVISLPVEDVVGIDI